METKPARCLINTISRFILLVSCQTMKFMPTQKDFESMTVLMKHLKPYLDEVADGKIRPDENLLKEYEKLDIDINEAREYMEKWSPKASKILSVWQSELVLTRIRCSSLEICRILCRLLQASPSTLIGVQNCMQELENWQPSAMLMQIERALKNQSDKSISVAEDLVEIINSLGLTSNQELLKERITIEKERIKAETNQIKGEVDQIFRAADFISLIQDYMLKSGYFDSCSGFSIPSYFRCPLSLEIMSDPVIVASGQTFERACIQKWIDHGLNICPITSQPLSQNASSSAANEAMSMILRLQREKAEVQMEARQFKRFSEEKMAHDAEEISALEELLYKREQAIQSLTCEVQAYKHRMMSFGLTESEAEGLQSDDGQNQIFNELGAQMESPSPTRNYPPLRCNLNDMQLIENDEDVVDIENYPFVESSRGQDHLMNLDYRINQLERSPRGCDLDGDFAGSKNSLEKVIVQSPMRSRNPRRGPSYSPLACGRDMGPDYPIDSPRMTSFRKMDCVEELKKCHDASDMGDEMIDRVYTIDSVHQGVPHNNPKEIKVPGICEEYVTTPGASLNRTDFGDIEVKKLYQRLQVLEADRESLKQTIMSVQTDKAQLVLLREIAQQLCKDMSTERRMPMKKQSPPGKFSFMTACKWFMSLVFWRKKARQSKYIGLSANNVGLLGVLDKGPLGKHWRCITSTQVGSRSWSPKIERL